MDLIYRVEELRPDSLPDWMLQDHYVENARIKEALNGPNPDWVYYMEQQRLGRLLFVAARRRDNLAIVGFIILALHRHPHYREVRVAIDDLHYLTPVYRGRGYGKRMLNAAEGFARAHGATLFSMRCKADSPTTAVQGGIFESMGYKLVDLVYVKDMRDEIRPPPPDLASG